jgi:hypothetical protein
VHVVVHRENPCSAPPSTLDAAPHSSCFTCCYTGFAEKGTTPSDITHLDNTSPRQLSPRGARNTDPTTVATFDKSKHTRRGPNRQLAESTTGGFLKRTLVEAPKRARDLTTISQLCRPLQPQMIPRLARWLLWCSLQLLEEFNRDLLTRGSSPWPYSRTSSQT